MSWRRSQTPELFALCLSERGWEEWRQKERRRVLFHFLGYVHQIVDTFFQATPPPASPPSLSPPVSMYYEKNVSGKCHICMGETDCVCVCVCVGGGGGSGSETICNLIWSSGEDCWGWLCGTGQGWDYGFWSNSRQEEEKSTGEMIVLHPVIWFSGDERDWFSGFWEKETGKRTRFFFVAV